MHILSTLGCWLILCMTPWIAQDPAAKTVPEKNPFDTDADAAIGKQYFIGHCAQCHGPDGEGGRGINLTTGRYRLGGSDRDLFQTIKRGIRGSEMPGARLSDNEVWRVVAFVRRLSTAGAQEKASGDPEAGKRVYESKGGCVPCHAIQRRGGSLGPELSEVGLRRSLKYLRESLTDPGAHINDEYRAVTVTTQKGEEITGIRLNEDEYSVQLRDLAENLRSFLRSELKDVKRERRSLMPAYGSVLSVAEIDNLVAYLSTLRGKP
jgi:putative heme-binding domain-containing protein